jgi:hypothetical protein
MVMIEVRAVCTPSHLINALKIQTDGNVLGSWRHCPKGIIALTKLKAPMQKTITVLTLDWRTEKMLWIDER